MSSGSQTSVVFLDTNIWLYAFIAGQDATKSQIAKDLNTVSHGVAPAELFSLKGAIIGLLILDQLSFYVGSQEGSS